MQSYYFVVDVVIAALTAARPQTIEGVSHATKTWLSELDPHSILHITLIAEGQKEDH